MNLPSIAFSTNLHMYAVASRHAFQARNCVFVLSLYLVVGKGVQGIVIGCLCEDVEFAVLNSDLENLYIERRFSENVESFLYEVGATIQLFASVRDTTDTLRVEKLDFWHSLLQ